MKYIIIIISILSLSLSCSATPQTLDMLIMHKDTFFLYNSPLVHKSNLIERDSNFIKSRIQTTATTRGYVATWELIGDEIYLTKINDYLNGKLEANLQIIFKTENDHISIKASWINEEIIARSKYPLHGYSIGFSEVYEEEFILKFEYGKLISTQHLNNKWAKKPNDITSILNEFVIKKFPKKLRKKICKDNLEYDFYTLVRFDINGKMQFVEFTETEFETIEFQKIIEKFDDWDFVYKEGKLMNEYAVRLKINEAEIKKHTKYR